MISSTKVLLLHAGLLIMGMAFTYADKIVKNDGSEVIGEITRTTNGRVWIKISAGEVGLTLTDVKSVEMAPPAALAAAKKSSPPEVITRLSTLLASYKGLPADWVIEASVLLADAYADEKKYTESNAIFENINASYPGLDPQYVLQVKVGSVKNLMKQNRFSDAEKLLEPIITQARQNIPKTVVESQAFARAYLCYGESLEAKGDLPNSLAAYMLAETIFTTNEADVLLAQKKIESLRASHPNVKTP